MYTNIITIYITISSYQDFVLFTNLVQHITQQTPQIGNFSISIDCILGFQTEPGIKHWVITTVPFSSQGTLSLIEHPILIQVFLWELEPVIFFSFIFIYVLLYPDGRYIRQKHIIWDWILNVSFKKYVKVHVCKKVVCFYLSEITRKRRWWSNYLSVYMTNRRFKFWLSIFFFIKVVHFIY